jgi:VWFA-related protein
MHSFQHCSTTLDARVLLAKGTVLVLGLLCVFNPAIAAANREVALEEEVDVSLVIVDLRAVDDDGTPILDLKAEDFIVRTAGRQARVASVEWFPGANPPLEVVQVGSNLTLKETEASPGRLLILFFERDLYPTRIVGLMQMLISAREFVQTLRPEDRVAIFVFDFHLEMICDFTSNHAEIRKILEQHIVPYHEYPFVPATDGPSLAEHLEPDVARSANSPEASLLMIANALNSIEGSKSLLYFGWGMGMLDAGTIRLQPEYGPAIWTLIESRTSVFTLDVTRADHHTLEVPLQHVAQETGGLYMRGYNSTYVAMDAVAKAISGHYELAFEKPALPPGRHEISIKLRGKQGRVYHREFYVD